MLDFFLSKGKNCYLVGIKTFKPSQSPSCCFLQQSVIRRTISFHKILVGIKTLKPSQSPSYCFLQQSIIRRKISFHKMPKITSLINPLGNPPIYLFRHTEEESNGVLHCSSPSYKNLLEVPRERKKIPIDWHFSSTRLFILLMSPIS